MLGKRPCLLRTSSSRSLLIPCDDAEGEPASFCQYVQVSGQNPSPALSSPCKIVIGFNIGNEKKPPPDFCESPRSVLDTPAVLPSQEKQQIVTRSPRSGLGSLLTNSGSVGLEIVAQIQSEEVDVHSHVVSVARRQAPYVHIEEDMEDECLDADISPRRIGAARIHLKQNVKYNFNGVNITSPYRSEGLHDDSSKGLKNEYMDADIFPQQSLAPWQSRGWHVPPIIGADNDAHISTRHCGASHVPPSKGMVDDCMFDHISTWQSEAHPYKDGCTDACITQWQRQDSHHMSLDMDCKEISINQSIFSAASPPSYPHSLVMSSTGFLNACAFCGHSLRLGKDIFMYRGDQAFCSAECRYQKIAFDEHKEKRGS